MTVQICVQISVVSGEVALLARRDGKQFNCCRAEPGDCQTWTANLQICLVTRYVRNTDF